MASASVFRLRVGSGAWDVSSSCLHESFAPAAKTECEHYVTMSTLHGIIIGSFETGLKKEPTSHILDSN